MAEPKWLKPMIKDVLAAHGMTKIHVFEGKRGTEDVIDILDRKMGTKLRLNGVHLAVDVYKTQIIRAMKKKSRDNRKKIMKGLRKANLRP